MSDATKRTCGCDWSLWETCDECNPDDEAAEIRRLRTRLAESEAEVGNQRRLRMLAEEAIPKGTEVARDYFAAEAEALLNRARAETDLVRQGLDLERTARLAAEAEAEKWRSEARRALAAEAERDDLLGALREIVDAIDVLAERAAEVGWIDKDQQVEARVDRARAAIAKVGGPARPEVERGKCGHHRVETVYGGHWTCNDCGAQRIGGEWFGGTGREGTNG